MLSKLSLNKLICPFPEADSLSLLLKLAYLPTLARVIVITIVFATAEKFN